MFIEIKVKKYTGFSNRKVCIFELKCDIISCIF